MYKLINALDILPKDLVEYAKIQQNDSATMIYDFTILLSDRNKYIKYAFYNNIERGEITYFLVSEFYPQYIIGCGMIKTRANNNSNTGDISYEIRPNERNKGYGKELLRLLLIECAKLGKEKVYISCTDSNEASKNVIISNGGKVYNHFTQSKGRYYPQIPCTRYVISINKTNKHTFSRKKK